MHVALQLYTVRRSVKWNLDQALRQAGALGYGWVETWKLPPKRKNADILRAAAAEYRVGHQSAQIAVAAMEADFAAQVNFLHASGCGIAVAAALPLAALRGGEERLKRFCQTLNRLAERFRQEDISLAFHHHHFEFLRFGSRRGIDILLEEYSGGFICDTYWAQRGGIAPESLIRRMGKRLVGVHLRDFSLERNGLRLYPADCPAGEGVLDIPAILQAAQQAGALYAAVEQNSRSPWRDAAKSLNYVRKLDVVNKEGNT